MAFNQLLDSSPFLVPLFWSKRRPNPIALLTKPRASVPSSAFSNCGVRLSPSKPLVINLSAIFKLLAVKGAEGFEVRALLVSPEDLAPAGVLRLVPGKIEQGLAGLK